MGLYNERWGTMLEVFPLKFRTNTAAMSGQFRPKSPFCLAGGGEESKIAKVVLGFGPNLSLTFGTVFQSRKLFFKLKLFGCKTYIGQVIFKNLDS